MPAGLAIDAGRYSLAVIFVAFVVVGFLALSLAEVSSRYDVTGGPQVYAQRIFGPATGFTVGWLFSVSRIASYALIAQVMLDYAAEIWPALAPPLAARRRDHRVHDRPDRDQCPRGARGAPGPATCSLSRKWCRSA